LRRALDVAQPDAFAEKVSSANRAPARSGAWNACLQLSARPTASTTTSAPNSRGHLGLLLSVPMAMPRRADLGQPGDRGVADAARADDRSGVVTVDRPGFDDRAQAAIVRSPVAWPPPGGSPASITARSVPVVGWT